MVNEAKQPESIREAVRMAKRNGVNCPLCRVWENYLCDYHEGYRDGWLAW